MTSAGTNSSLLSNTPLHLPHTMTSSSSHPYNYPPSFYPSLQARQDSPAGANLPLSASLPPNPNPQFNHQNSPANLPLTARSNDSNENDSTDTPASSSLPPNLPNFAHKSRSVAACILCRKQKMKCEGPGAAPCRRCRAAGVECTFEAPPQAPPRVRGNGVTLDYVDGRFAAVEERVKTLETDSRALVTRTNPQQIQSPQPDTERRIAALEAQVYALHLSHAHSHSSPHQTQPGYPAPGHTHSVPYVGPNVAFQAQHGHSSSNMYYTPSAAPYPNLDRGRFQVVHENGGNRATKRWKGEEFSEEADFITRGVIEESEARLCFDSYFSNFSGENSDSTNRPITLPFTETRQRSSLVTATVISIGARSLTRMDTYRVSIAEALRLAKLTFLPEPGEEPTSLDLKGLILLSVYNGLIDLIPHSILLSYRYNLPTALIEYENLSEKEKFGSRGKILITRGRTFLVSWLSSSFYSHVTGNHGGYTIPEEVLRRQFDVLESSPFAQQPSDRGIRVNGEECLILRRVFYKLGAAMHTQLTADLPLDEIFEIIESGICELKAWSAEHLEMMQVITTWGDEVDLKTSLPYHHGVNHLLMWFFRRADPAAQYPNLRANAKLREFCQMGKESALGMLKWGVESRIWLPHSMSSCYLHYVNIPTAVHLLAATSRLFPEDFNFPAIRTLLHRLIKQCDNCITGNYGTARETRRAQQTKQVVLEFDRFAFEQSNGEESSEAKPEEAEGVLFGDEISKSLAALGYELGLWGGILEGALEDEQHWVQNVV